MIDLLANLDPLLVVGAVALALLALALSVGRPILAAASRRQPLPVPNVFAVLAGLFGVELFVALTMLLRWGRSQAGAGTALLLSLAVLLGLPLLALVGYAWLRRRPPLRPGALTAVVATAAVGVSGLLLAWVWSLGGWPPLAYAASRNDTRVVELLLGLGLSPDAAARFGRRPLDYAAWRANPEVARLLLAAGADVNAGNGAALWTALWSGRPEVLRVLVEAGADVSVKDLRGWTPLMHAVSGCDEQLVDLLLGAGAAASFSSAERLDEARAACRRGDRERLARLMLQEELHNSLSASELAGRLLGAAHSGELGAIENLLAAGAAIEARDPVGRTPLARAAAEGRLEMVELLLARGAAIDAVDEEGQSPLAEACSRGDEAVARVLLEHGANPSLRDTLHRSPLDLACDSNHEAVVRLLGGACPAPVRASAPDGAEAAAGDPFAVQHQMVSARASGREAELLNAIADGDVAAVERALRDGFDVNRRSDVVAGGTPLLWAAYCDRPEVIRLLLERGADPNLASEPGVTPLVEAAKRGHAETVRLLLEGGADPNRATGKGWTALIWSVEGGHREVVELLLAHGADVRARNNRGETALAVATRSGHQDLVALLQAHGG